MNLWLLFFEFFKIGLFSVGGGLATLPFLNKLVEKYDWFTSGDLANIIAVSESTPGPLGINMASYTGFTGAGIIGGIIATVGIVLPSFLVILIIASMLQKFNENRYVQTAFVGLRSSVVGLISAAVLGIMELSFIQSGGSGLLELFNWKAIAAFLVLVLLRFRFQKAHPIILIVIGAVVGMAVGGF